MRLPRRLLIGAALLAFVASARGAPNEKRPYIGFLYAAGGQQGDTVQVVAGGQNLRGVRGVYVSGEGVTAKVVKFRPGRPSKKILDKAKEIIAHLEERYGLCDLESDLVGFNWSIGMNGEPLIFDYGY